MNLKKEFVAPNYTIYINNLNEKVKVKVLKKLLYEMFGQFGRILNVVCSKQGNKRGQAFIVYDSIESAKLAKQKKDGCFMINKAMRINFAKTKSDVIAQLDGTYEEHIKKRKLTLGPEVEENSKKKRKIDENEKEEKIKAPWENN